ASGEFLGEDLPTAATWRLPLHRDRNPSRNPVLEGAEGPLRAEVHQPHASRDCRPLLPHTESALLWVAGGDEWLQNVHVHAQAVRGDGAPGGLRCSGSPRLVTRVQRATGRLPNGLFRSPPGSPGDRLYAAVDAGSL